MFLKLLPFSDSTFKLKVLNTFSVPSHFACKGVSTFNAFGVKTNL